MFVFQNVDILRTEEVIKQLGSILKTDVRACKAVGHPFVVQVNLCSSNLHVCAYLQSGVNFIAVSIAEFCAHNTM